MRACAAVLVSLALVVSSAAAQPTSLVGLPAPEIRARSLDGGDEITLASMRGSVVLLAFVASWCGACRRLEPQLAEIERERRERGLRVLALSHESRARLRAHVARQPPPITLAQCTGHTAVVYEARALPTLALVDRRGIVRGAWQGLSPGLRGALERAIDLALGEAR